MFFTIGAIFCLFRRFIASFYYTIIRQISAVICSDSCKSSGFDLAACLLFADVIFEHSLRI